ncbi:MAG: CehA/McbA family metallohydrolase, partial [Verrucomicrobiales bacterium]
DGYHLQTGETTPLGIGPEDPATLRRKRTKFAPSPDGKSIFYAIHRDEPNEQGGNRGPQADLWRCGADGGGAQLLFTWPARIFDLTVSPAAESLVVVTDLGATHDDLWRIPLAAPLKQAQRLTANHADDEHPSFDRAGTLLAWTDNSGGATMLKLRDFESGREGEISLTGVDFGEESATLKLSVVDQKTGAPVTARVSVKRRDGKFFSPLKNALYRLTGSFGHFYAEGGSASIELPLGDYEIRVFRGPEYEVASQSATVSSAAQSVQVPLKRWIDMAERGWYSGENHVHANYGYGEWYNTPETIRRQCAGENLNVCNTVIANSDGEAVFDREFFLGQLDPRSTGDTLVYWGQEFRSTIWGHLTLSNLSQLVEPIMTGFPGTTNPWDVPTNADIAQRVSDQGGLVGYTHPAGNPLDLYDQPYASKGLPVDAALGRIALMDVHGHTYKGSTQLWYRLLNCGLPVVGSSGTDVFLNRLRSLPPGWARTYVHLPDGLGYQSWTEGQRAGRSFFTNGPMLSFSVNGIDMGGALKLPEAGPVKVSAKAESRLPLGQVELVHNGKVIHTLDLADDNLSSTFDAEINLTESGWLALRAQGSANAHTNPVWIEIDGAPNSAAATDAAYFLKWIDRLETDLKERDRIPNERLWKHVRGQLNKAREFYRALL